jgi:hypothetical protein
VPSQQKVAEMRLLFYLHHVRPSFLYTKKKSATCLPAHASRVLVVKRLPDQIFNTKVVEKNEQHISIQHSLRGSRGSSGSIVSDYGLDDRGSILGRGRGFFL